MSILIPKDELTLTDMKDFRGKAINAGIARAVALKVAGAADQLNVRAWENILDAGAALDQWNTAALVAVGIRYSVFQAIPAPILAANKVAVFYKVGVETTPVPVSLLTFRIGGAVGNIKAEFDLEQLVNCLTQEGYFSQPVVYDPTNVMAVQVMARIATGVLARVQFGAIIIEPAGQLVSG